MNCAYCKSEIENDSLYCDQCSKELFICPACGKPGKGKNCIEDGSKLFSPKQKSLIPVQDENQINPAVAPLQHSVLIEKPDLNPLIAQQAVTPSNFVIPVLRLVNFKLNITIDIKDGEIIGSAAGEHVGVFKELPQVSGTHAKFVFDRQNGWMVMDVGSTGQGSTNGTAISNIPDWQNVSKLQPGKPAPLKDNSLLLIANIEFQVKIGSSQTPHSKGTQRL